MGTDILRLADYVRQGGEDGRARGEQSYLAKLASQGLGASGAERDGIVQQAVATNPQAGFRLADQLKERSADDYAELGQAASIFSTIPEEQKQDFYASKLVPLAHKQGFKVPDVYDPRYAPMIEKLGQSAAGKGDDLKSLRIGENGNYWAIRGGQFVDTGTKAVEPTTLRDPAGGTPGLVGMRTGQVRGLSVAGQPGAQPQPQGQPQYAPAPDIEMQTLPGADVPPGDEVAMLAAAQNEGTSYQPQANGGALPVSAPSQPQGGVNPLIAPRPAPQSAQPDTFAPLSQDEVVQMGFPAGTVAQRSMKTGQVSVLNRPAAQTNTTGGVNLQKLQQGNATKLAQFNTAERALTRIESAAADIGKNKMFDGGPMDAVILAKTPQGQELEQASASLLPVLTALTRVPGVGAQSDLESRLATLQMPSAEFPPEVNRRAAQALREYIRDLKSAYQTVEAPKSAAPAAPAGWSIKRVN